MTDQWPSCPLNSGSINSETVNFGRWPKIPWKSWAIHRRTKRSIEMPKNYGGARRIFEMALCQRLIETLPNKQCPAHKTNSNHFSVLDFEPPRSINTLSFKKFQHWEHLRNPQMDCKMEYGQVLRGMPFLWRDQAHLWNGLMPEADWDPTAQYSKDHFIRVTNLENIIWSRINHYILHSAAPLHLWQRDFCV